MYKIIVGTYNEDADFETKVVAKDLDFLDTVDKVYDLISELENGTSECTNSLNIQIQKD